MAKILFKRGTRAQVDAAKGANSLAAGEPYLVTDDATVAVGTAAGTYLDLPAITGAKRIAVVATLPGTPDPDTLYFTTS